MKRHFRWIGQLLLIAVIVCLWDVSITAACPTCKDAMVHSNQLGVQQGYYWSILFMMSMPFCIFGGWMFYIWRVCRRPPEVSEERLLTHSTSTL